jgi:hypothetical protein
VFLLGLAGGVVRAEDLRTWTDITGKHKIEAKYVGAFNGKITLEQADGSRFEIENRQLSVADQEYVIQKQNEEKSGNPFRKMEPPSPFQKKAEGATAGPPAEAAAASAPAASSGPRTVRVEWDEAEVIGLTPTSTEWKVDVPRPAPEAAPAKLRPVPLPQKANFFERVKELVVNAPGTRAVVGYAGGSPGQKAATRLVLCDLENGKMLGQASTPGQYVPLALSDDAGRVLVRTDDFGPGKRDRLEIWSLGKGGITKLIESVLYEGENDRERDIRWAAFLDAERFATISESGKLVIWRLDTLKPLATLQAGGGGTPAISPDRKRIAFNTGKEIGILDVATREVVALQPAPMPNMAWTTMSFSPSGARLGCQVFVSKMFIYDTATGALRREVPLQGMNGQGRLVWPDEKSVLLGGQTLIDLASLVRVWSFQGGEHAREVGGLVWFVVTPMNQQGGLVPAKIPPPGVEQALARALADPELFIVKEGASVSVDASGIPDASQRDRVVRDLTASLARNGIKVAANRPVVVQASMERGKEEEVSYRTIGMGFGVDTFKVRPWIVRVKFVYQGKTAWETGQSSMPFMDFAHLKKDESLADHVKSFEKPNYEIFGRIELPKMLQKPGQQTLGVSQVTIAGVR